MAVKTIDFPNPIQAGVWKYWDDDGNGGFVIKYGCAKQATRAAILNGGTDMQAAMECCKPKMQGTNPQLLLGTLSSYPSFLDFINNTNGVSQDFKGSLDYINPIAPTDARPVTLFLSAPLSQMMAQYGEMSFDLTMPDVQDCSINILFGTGDNFNAINTSGAIMGRNFSANIPGMPVGVQGGYELPLAPKDKIHVSIKQNSLAITTQYDKSPADYPFTKFSDNERLAILISSHDAPKIWPATAPVMISNIQVTPKPVAPASDLTMGPWLMFYVTATGLVTAQSTGQPLQHAAGADKVQYIYYASADLTGKTQLDIKVPDVSQTFILNASLTDTLDVRNATQFVPLFNIDGVLPQLNGTPIADYQAQGKSYGGCATGDILTIMRNSTGYDLLRNGVQLYAVETSLNIVLLQIGGNMQNSSPNDPPAPNIYTIVT